MQALMATSFPDIQDTGSLDKTLGQNFYIYLYQLYLIISIIKRQVLMPLATKVELSCFSLILSIFCFSCLGTFWLGAEIICLSSLGMSFAVCSNGFGLSPVLFVLVPTQSLLCSTFEGCCFVHFCPFHWLWSESLANSCLMYFVLTWLLFSWTI